MDETLRSFFTKGQQLKYKKGEIIIRPDDRPSGIFFIEKGYVKIYSLTIEGEEKLHIIYKPGEIFPLIWALRSIQKEIFYEALDNMSVYRVSKREFLNFISSHPQAVFDYLERVANAFDVFVDRVDNLEIPKSYPRLIYMLLFLSARFGLKENKGILIAAPISHKDIANSIAITRETASRELVRLEKNGLISYQNHLIFIPNLNNLQKELETHQKRGFL